MELNFLVFDENSVIASFKYYNDAIAFIHTIVPDFQTELFGYDIFDIANCNLIEYKKIREAALKPSIGCVDE